MQMSSKIIKIFTHKIGDEANFGRASLRSSTNSSSFFKNLFERGSCTWETEGKKVTQIYNKISAC